MFGNAAQADVVAREVLTSHLRSLMPGHLMDVVSTDQHTVKPWFDGRIDFSPPVNDFAANGFRLIGGRLDYLDGRPAAALVYQRRKHIVNVFVWPAADGSQSAVESTAHDGYNLLHWRRGGMNYWMASDLNAQEMGDFAHLLREGVLRLPERVILPVSRAARRCSRQDQLIFAVLRPPASFVVSYASLRAAAMLAADGAVVRYLKCEAGTYGRLNC